MKLGSTVQQEATMRKATRTFNLNDEDDAAILRDCERRGQPVLRPFESMRVPLQMMDSVDNSRAAIELAKAATYRAGEKVGLHNRPDVRITDGAGGSGLTLHRPGYRVAHGVPRDDSHYTAYDAAAEVAYKNIGAREREALGQCVDRQGDAASATDDRSAAYQEYEDRIQNAWRNL
jgi:hypothetical protein